MANDITVATAPAPSRELPAPRHRSRRLALWILGGLVVLAILGYWLVPLLISSLTTISTDDAYVNGHVTFVAPRVAGQVAEVLVDDNQRVRKGSVLVRLDRRPYEVQVELKQAAQRIADAQLVQAQAQVRALEAQARAARWKLQTAIESVRNQTATLSASVETLNRMRASLNLAQKELRRAEALARANQAAVSREELDQKVADVRVNEAQVAEALENVRKLRVTLGLPPDPPPGKPLTDVPPNLEQNFSAVRTALADLSQAVAQIGLELPGSNTTPAEAIQKFLALAPGGDIDQFLTELVQKAPPVLLAKAQQLQAQRDLEQAELNLSYTDIVAEIDGVVGQRNVNPGNNVQIGQSLMTVRSEREVWVDANFKETQLAELRIGQPVTVYFDAYGSRPFDGRVSGFRPATGAASALLPPENATGNFVKVVQRVPVRIDLLNFDPEQTPFAVGLSAVPYVHYREPTTGPDAGQRLQRPLPVLTAPAGPTAPGPRVAPPGAAPS